MRKKSRKAGSGETARKGAAGELPSAADLQNAGSLASLSFGQGGLTVTPLQVTAMFNAIASGGVYHSPCIVSSITGGTQVPQQPQPAGPEGRGRRGAS